MSFTDSALVSASKDPRSPERGKCKIRFRAQRVLTTALSRTPSIPTVWEFAKSLRLASVGLAVLSLSTPVWCQLSHTFNSNSEGWTALFPTPQVSWVSAGGNPGGCIRLQSFPELIAPGTVLAALPSCSGGTISFDSYQWMGTTQGHARLHIDISRGNSYVSCEMDASQVFGAWGRYTFPLEAQYWGGNSTLAHVLAQPTWFRIESIVTIHNLDGIALDNFQLSTSSATAMMTGRVSMASQPVSGARVSFRSSSGNSGPVSTDAAGFYSLTVNPASLGRLEVYLLGATYCHEPLPRSQIVSPSSLEFSSPAAGQNVTLDFQLPLPVIMIHGILSDSQRWNGAISEFRLALRERLQYSRPLAQPLITLTAGWNDDGLGANRHLPESAAIVAQTMATLRSNVLGPHNLQNVPVNILAHSLGGLVSRVYLHSHVAPGQVRHVFTLGTPHMGALALLYSVPISPNWFDMHPAVQLLFYAMNYYDTKGATFHFFGSSVNQGAVPENVVRSFPALMAGLMDQFVTRVEDDGIVSTYSSVLGPIAQLGLPLHGMTLTSDSHDALGTTGSASLLALLDLLER